MKSLISLGPTKDTFASARPYFCCSPPSAKYLSWLNFQVSFKGLVTNVSRIEFLLCLSFSYMPALYSPVFGNLVFMAGFVIILQYVAHDYIPLNKLPWVEKPTSWARGFATAVFAFEGKGTLTMIYRTENFPKTFLSPNECRRH